MHFMRQHLDDIAMLKEGWDAYGEAVPVNTVVINHVRKILSRCKPSDLSEWRLSPNVNGTMLLELDDAAISIGIDSFTYYAEVEGKDIGEEYLPFTVDGVINTIRKINSYYA